MAKTFKHSGKLGDIIFSLPTMRALGGGVLYLDPEGGARDPFIPEPVNGHGRRRLDKAAIDSIRPLLLQQPYITDVRYWENEAVDYNLEKFRMHLAPNKTVADYHLDAFGLPSFHRDYAWLQVDQPTVIEGYPTVISRTARYHGNDGMWEEFLPAHHKTCVFVGLPKEHEIFEYTFGYQVRYVPTPTLLDLARVIAGCKLLACNTSMANAIGEGLKHQKLVEVYRAWPNIIFVRPGATYG